MVLIDPGTGSLITHPYIDPGTGSLIIQLLIASFVGGIFLLKIFWGKVKAFLKKIFSKATRGNG